jgi:hypothetical protein
MASEDIEIEATITSKLLDILKNHPDGITTDELTISLGEECNAELVNKLLKESKVEMVNMSGTSAKSLIIRIKKGSSLGGNATGEEELVFLKP